MPNARCRQCGYDLTGLPDEGACPECGARYDEVSLAVDAQREQAWIAYMPAMGCGGLTLMILFCGGLLTLISSKPASAILMTLIFAAVTGFASFVYWFTARKERRGED